MIDLVLQDSRVPAIGFYQLRFAVLVDAADAYVAVAGHYGGVAGNAETAFEKFKLRIGSDL